MAVESGQVVDNASVATSNAAVDGVSDHNGKEVAAVKTSFPKDNDGDEDYEDDAENTTSLFTRDEVLAVNKTERMSRLDTLLQRAKQYVDFLHTKIEVSHERRMAEAASAVPPPQKKRKRTIAAKKKKAEPSPGDDTSDSNLIPQPECMSGGTLRSYQLQGFSWMVGLWENGLHGILADEMGLGKTVQTIALLAHLRDKKVAGPFLVVAPLSTLPNWISELRKWTPTMPSIIYHGTVAERAELRTEHMAIKGGRAGLDFPVICTSYEIIMRDRKYLQHYPWKYIIVDEGHRLKNMNCRLIRELKQYQFANRLLLTGTPLQNNLAELWSLLNFLLPDIFNDLAFFESCFNFDQVASADADKDEIIAAEQKDQIVSKLHTILRPFMMRRLKNDVEKSLKPKREIVVYAGMTECQQVFYRKTVDGELRNLLSAAGKPSKGAMNNLWMQLRKVCNHPYLVHEDAPVEAGVHTTEDIVQQCSKLLLLDKMLRSLKSKGHKVLIFSQMTRLLDILEDYMVLRRHSYCRLDGNTKIQDRFEQMKTFNEDPDCFCFMLSTRAGGLGINLVSADTVIIYDSDWNPHQDNQAQDRAHRIGQKKQVFVYRLITTNSVELKMLARANSKRKLERLVISNGSGFKHDKSPEEKFSLDDMKQMLRDDVEGVQDGNNPKAIDDTSLAHILDRDVDWDSEPLKGTGYEVVEWRASSLVGNVTA